MWQYAYNNEQICDSQDPDKGTLSVNDQTTLKVDCVIKYNLHKQIHHTDNHKHN